MIPFILSVLLVDPLEQFDIPYLLMSSINTISVTLLLHIGLLGVLFFVRLGSLKGCPTSTTSDT